MLKLSPHCHGRVVGICEDGNGSTGSINRPVEGVRRFPRDALHYVVWLTNRCWVQKERALAEDNIIKLVGSSDIIF